jgi:hypothetical protein
MVHGGEELVIKSIGQQPYSSGCCFSVSFSCEQFIYCTESVNERVCIVQPSTDVYRMYDAKIYVEGVSTMSVFCMDKKGYAGGIWERI